MAVSREQLFRILKEHYILDMSQKEIAKFEKLSTATISRLIKEAKAQGYVKIELNLPDNSVPELEKKIRDRFGVSFVSVTRVQVDDQDMIIHDVAQPFSDYLYSIMKDGDVIGLSWGRTLCKMALDLHVREPRDVTFVSLSGGVTINVTETGVEQTVRRFASAFDAQGFAFPLPAYLANEVMKEAVLSDEQFSELFDLIRRAQIAVFSVGPLNTSSLLYESGYFSYPEMEELIHQGFVGDICGRLIRSDGNYEKEGEYTHSVGITLEELKKKQHKMCVVTQTDKAEVLACALKGGFIDELFVDESTAERLLRL